MKNFKPHRNSQKRYYGQGKIYYIVTKTYKNFPYFKEPILCDLLIEELRLCKELKGFKLFAFSLIYDHLNLLLKPSEELNVSRVMQSIKKEFSRDVNYIISNDNKNSIHHNEGDIPECRLRGYQYSQQYNKKFNVPYLLNYRQQFIKKYGNPQFKIPQFKWQRSFHDHIIRNEKDFINHYNYTAYNHLKHRLPRNWEYTSLNFKDLIDGIAL
jgi:REP element-mobilizing transposase RayT